MDIATIFGLIVALGAIFGAYSLEGGELDSIFLTSPLLIVLGGTLGATMITTSIKTVRQVPTFLKLAFFREEGNYHTNIEVIVKLAEMARMKGILSLEEQLSHQSHPFHIKALQLIIDGTEATVLREILETELAYIDERHKKGITFFQKAGGFAPTMGILGTVLGLIQAMSNTDDASQMASAIAAAFIATLWGVGSANLFFLPISDKLRMRHEEEIAQLEIFMEGAIALQTGDNPRAIRIRLMSFVSPERHRIEV